MHSLGIVHRDLKPDNILMTDNSETAELKISDFGLSKVFGPNELDYKTSVGTLCYAAPEIFLGKPCGKEVDFFSLGAIIYLMLVGRLPFDDIKDKEVIRMTIEE